MKLLRQVKLEEMSGEEEKQSGNWCAILTTSPSDTELQTSDTYLAEFAPEKHFGLFFDDVSNPLAHVCGVGSVLESDGARGWDVIEHLMSKSCRVFSEMVLVT